MTANELADKIEYARNETDFQKWAGQAPDMLRQLQTSIEHQHQILRDKDTEIESLKARLKIAEQLEKTINLANYIRAQEK